MTEDEIAMEYVRWWLGNLTESQLSEEDMQKLMAMVNTQYPDATLCQKQYYLAVSVLKFLIRKDSQGGAGSVGSGDVKSLEESRGDTKIKKEWYDSSTSTASSASWDTILEDLESEPDSIGCSVFSEETSTSTGSVIIGGTGKDRFDTSAPWRENLLSPKRKSWTCIK